MTLQLDARQRAMLEEFGVRLFDRPAAAPPAAVPPARRAAAPERTPLPSVAPAVAPPQRTPARVPPPARVAPMPVNVAPMPVNVAAERGPRPPVETLEWDALEQAVAGCRACGLCEGRRNTVFGVGDRQADWLIVGEAPGENEDIQGEPFVGQAGKLLDNMLRALALSRQHKVYIANVLKCRPPGNRNPEPAEVAQCEPFLRRQVALLRPRIILTMGRFAVQSLLGSTEPIGRLRGRIHQYAGVPLVVTYHPAYLLRNLPDKAKAWADLCLAASVLEQGDQGQTAA
ncbi:MAG TPA: uracil-DNA glycosylase [Ramlibacter sp.]|nr:uracil-DNA glycosylase [Ramlibacter sp.]